MTPEQAKAIRAQREEKLHAKQQLERLTSMEKTIVSSMRQLVQFLDGKQTKTEVINQLKSIQTPDVDKVVKAVEKLDESITKGKLDISPLTKGLEALEKKLDKLPQSFPELPQAPDTMKVSNLGEIDYKPLIKAIQGLDVKPQVKVDAPVVNVDAPDLNPIKELFSSLLTATQNIKLPETDLSKVEKHLEESNKKLQKLVEKPVGGGSGGGSGTSFKDSTGKLVYVETEADNSIPVTIKADESVSTVYSKPLDEYQLVQDAETATHEYYGYVRADGSWCLKRITISTAYAEFVRGASNYTTAWTDRATQTYQNYWEAF